MKASQVVIVMAVLVLVGGVAWFRSTRASRSAAPAAPTSDAVSAKEGALGGNPPPAEPAASAPASVATMEPAPASGSAPAASQVAATSVPATGPAADKKLPRIVDLGADKCVPCKKLAPILEELKKEYAGRVVVEFIDVWKDPKAGEPYKIRVIPTQIFYDRDGKEVWRHEGFLPKEDFLAKFAELGVK